MHTIAEQRSRCFRKSIARHSLFALALILLQACRSLDIRSATTLAQEGRLVAAAASSQIFASSMEFQNATEAEIFMHAYAGVETPARILETGNIAMLELSKRKTVFSRLADTYAALYDLASNDAPARMETAINTLGDAVNDYGATLGSAPFMSTESVTIAGAISRAALTAKKKKMIMHSSALIRERLGRLLKMLENPLVRQQMVTWKTNLAQNRASLIQMLMTQGVLDTTPLLHRMGSDAGLQGAAEASEIIRKNQRLRNGLEQVIAYRLQNNLLAIDKGYDAACSAIRELIVMHETLEKGEPLTVAAVRSTIAELQVITDKLNK